jgi:hypothetical protein
MYDLPDDDLRKIKTCWKYNILMIKLHADTAHLVGYNKTVYKVMHRMNNNIKLVLIL